MAKPVHGDPIYDIAFEDLINKIEKANNKTMLKNIKYKLVHRALRVFGHFVTNLESTERMLRAKQRGGVKGAKLSAKEVNDQPAFISAGLQCTCHAGNTCPLGRRGSEPRCTFSELKGKLETVDDSSDCFVGTTDELRDKLNRSLLE